MEENLEAMKWKFREKAYPPDSYDLPYIIALTLSTRKIHPDNAYEFLFPEEKETFDPFIMKGIQKALERLDKARENKERILIHGDYDVDGITGTTLLFRVLDKLGFAVDYYIPDRLKEGYGLSKQAIKTAKEEGFSIILTVDTGITAIQESFAARFAGVDLIITDHHEPKRKSGNSNKTHYKQQGFILPDAYAIINPKLEEEYPDKNLSGVGVAYKLLEALYRYYDYDLSELEEELDLVTLGTVADLVPLLMENRILVKKGLIKLKNSSKPGIVALKEVSGIKNGDINPFHISFILGPRINAPGRVSHAYEALNLLLSHEEEEARKLAENLQKLNEKRREEEKKVFEEAMEQVSKMDLKNTFAIVLASENWNHGIIGIVASKLVQEFRRPVVLLALEGKWGTGSGRSIEEFDLYQALQGSEDLLERYGGHKLACGLKINRKNIEKFKERLNEHAFKVLKEVDTEPVLEVDGEVLPSHLLENFLEHYERLKPFGASNPEPIFVLRNASIVRESIKILRDKHIAFDTKLNDGTLRSIYFDGIKNIELLKEADKLDIAFSILPKNGSTFELKIIDLKANKN